MRYLSAIVFLQRVVSWFLYNKYSTEYPYFNWLKIASLYTPVYGISSGELIEHNNLHIQTWYITLPTSFAWHSHLSPLLYVFLNHYSVIFLQIPTSLWNESFLVYFFFLQNIETVTLHVIFWVLNSRLIPINWKKINAQKT